MEGSSPTTLEGGMSRFQVRWTLQRLIVRQIARLISDLVEDRDIRTNGMGNASAAGGH
jgi:hypothetical protein